MQLIKGKRSIILSGSYVPAAAARNSFCIEDVSSGEVPQYGGARRLLCGGFTMKPKFYKYENTKVLLDDSIYPCGPPPDFAAGV